MIVVTILYAGRFVSKPAAELYGFGLSAIGIAAALSAICLSATSPVGGSTTLPILRYAGEKFLHSCLLLIQILIVAFARDTVLTWEWVSHHDAAKRAVEAVANTLGMFVMGTAAWCWLWAFDEVNKELWTNWRQRITDINRDRPSAAAVRDEASPKKGSQGERYDSV